MKKFTYLMLNTRNGLYKIGESNLPKFREKTLWSEEPEVEIYAAFTSEKCNEKILHETFAKKRIRGEWFALNEQDLINIKNTVGEFSIFNMEDYEINEEIKNTTIKSKINLLYKPKHKVKKEKII
jgi:hypothetical protein